MADATLFSSLQEGQKYWSTILEDQLQVSNHFSFIFACAQIKSNDVIGEGVAHNSADKVVEEIKKAGGIAAANYESVEFGDKVVKDAIDKFGRVDILINNAGILRDKSFPKMTDADWDKIMAVHLKGAFTCARACWPYFRDQGFG